MISPLFHYVALMWQREAICYEVEARVSMGRFLIAD